MAIPWSDLAIILALIALNGFFAAAELAVVSSRQGRLQKMEAEGVRGAAAVMHLQVEQGRFLSVVQIGITLLGIANGAYSGVILATPAALLLEQLGMAPGWAQQLGFILVIVTVTYLSLIIGELVPKQLALLTPEPIAVIVAPAMVWLTKVTGPLVSLLDASSSAIFRLLRIDRTGKNAVTEEELRHMVAEAEVAGIIEEEERDLISGIMRLADRPVRGVMTPRTEVDWIDIQSPADVVRTHLIETPHTRLVIGDGSVDNIIGVIQARDALAVLLGEDDIDLHKLLRKAPVIPDVADATDALTALRDADVPMAIVIDEYGHFEGVVTPADLLTAIAGEFRSDMDDGHDPAFVPREDGSFLVAGSFAADEFAERLGFRLDEERDYHTVAGLALAALEHIPTTGETFDAYGLNFEIVDMDGRRIDRLIVSRQNDEP